MASPAETAAMERSLQLALEGRGTTFPNPMVGAVVLSPSGEAIGEGFHRGCGSPHAETVALGQAGDAARGATLVVNLEPCCHHGKTRPCVHGIVEAGIARVVTSIEDPDPRVRGRGLAYLREKGVDIETGVLADRAEEVNEVYLHYKAAGRSLVRLKLAMSVDGRIALANGLSRWITGEKARERAHLMRARSDAVMAGARTVREDDPQLTVRMVDIDMGRKPARIIVSSRGEVPVTSKVLDPGPRTIVVVGEHAPGERIESLSAAGAEIWQLPDGSGGVDLDRLVHRTAAEGMGEVLCEGGGTLAASLLGKRLVDRVSLVYGMVIIGGDGRPGVGELGLKSLSDAPRLEKVRFVEIDGEPMLEGRVVYGAD